MKKKARMYNFEKYRPDEEEYDVSDEESEQRKEKEQNVNLFDKQVYQNSVTYFDKS